MGNPQQQRYVNGQAAGLSRLAFRPTGVFGTLLLLFPFVGGAQTVGVTMYPLPASGTGPGSITVGPDGALWFTEVPVNTGGNAKIGRITTGEAVSEYPLVARSAQSIVTGPDGALWFVEQNAAYNLVIGRMTTAGATSDYTYSGSPSAITTGPDGALWFVGLNIGDEQNPVGRITADGAITILSYAQNSTGIVAGPDGALWFTEYNKIGRLTTAGVLTEYPVPTNRAYNGGIAAGPDGALWFTESQANQIGRITTSGVVTEYPIPTAASGPGGIPPGPDGALWFTEGNQIGRVTTAGVITEYPIPVSAGGSQGLAGIATGPDGALWFTAYSGNSIGRAVLNVEPAVVAGTPSSGSGVTQTFTLQFSHPSGYQNLGVVNALIGSSLDARNACYLAYVPSSSTLYLVDDAGDAGGPFAGQVALGNAGTIRNSQCAVNLASAAGNGTTLTLVLNIAFQPGFGGNKIAFLAARDLGAGSSGWQPAGVWQVPSAAPAAITVTGVTPAQGSGPAGTGQQFQLTLTDTKGTSDFGIANLLINGNFVDGRKACYLAYVAANNTLSLVDDAGDAGGPYAGSMVLNGQSGPIENGQCQVTAVGTSVTYSANTIALTLNITFKAGFAGNRVVYAAGRDIAGGNNTGWQPVGTWTVQ